MEKTRSSRFAEAMNWQLHVLLSRDPSIVFYKPKITHLLRMQSLIIIK